MSAKSVIASYSHHKFSGETENDLLYMRVESEVISIDLQVPKMIRDSICDIARAGDAAPVLQEWLDCMNAANEVYINEFKRQKENKV